MELKICGIGTSSLYHDTVILSVHSGIFTNSRSFTNKKTLRDVQGVKKVINY